MTSPLSIELFGVRMRLDVAGESVYGRALYRGSEPDFSVSASSWPSRAMPTWHVTARAWVSELGLDVSMTASGATIEQAAGALRERAQQHVPALHQRITAGDARSSNAA